MPTFTHEEANEYDSRITRLVPGYDLLHTTTAVQLKATLGDNAHILVVGSGTGKDIAELAALNPSWHFTAQDISTDMLNIGQKRFADLGISDRVKIHVGAVEQLTDTFDAALCLLVLHFVADDGDKKSLLRAVAKQLKPSAQLYLADLMRPETSFERDAQFSLCQQLGLTDIGVERMKHNFEHEFYPLDRLRLSELLDNAGYNAPKLYFKALGFSGYVIQKR
ncbi:MAG: class I SAM-dependent methyltransferase [Pseudoalteromonas prydzensis]|uniref:Class I SAM-dependent methyltransferase n=2 Tax=root TaxID=1 RepID=A0A7V1CXI0_9GAMM|nr:class I SAM-dependent methyltransferase [Pseudoalteromonas prydzensis]HEA16142.1 class I SAM-dependent methyltransferase [Pseudoalteromonas prydzensis]